MLANRLTAKGIWAEAGFTVLAALLVAALIQVSPVLTTAALVAIPLAAWIILRPRIGLALMVILMPLQRSILTDAGTYASWAPLIPLSVALLVSLAGKTEDLTFRRHLPQWLVLVLLGYIALHLYVQASVTRNGALLVSLSDLQEAGGLPKLKYMLQFPLLFWITSFLVSSRRELKVIVYSLAALIFLLSLVGLYDFAGKALHTYNYLDVLERRFLYAQADPAWVLAVQKQFGAAAAGVYRGWAGNAQLGNFLVTAGLACFPFLITSTRGRPSLPKVLIFALLGLSAVTLFFTYSLGNWLSLIVGLSVLGLLLSTRKVQFALGTAIFVVLVVLSVYAVPAASMFTGGQLGQLQDKIIEAQKLVSDAEYPNNPSLVVRLGMLRAGWSLFIDSPVLGQGFGLFRVLAPQTGYVTFTDSLLPYAHNAYILILSELGLAGMAWFLVVLYSVLRTAGNSKAAADNPLRYTQAGALAAVAANLIYFLDYGDWSWNLNFWLVAGLAVAIRRIVRDEGVSAEGPSP